MGYIPYGGSPQPTAATGMTNDLASLMAMSAPQSPYGGAGGRMPGTQKLGQAPGTPGMLAGGAPNQAGQTQDSRNKLTSALMSQAGSSLTSPSSAPNAGMSAMGGALQGASLAGMVTGKSPMQMAMKALKPSPASPPVDPLSTAAQTGMDPMSFANMLQGMPADPAAESAQSMLPEALRSAAGQQGEMAGNALASGDALVGAAPGAEDVLGLGAGEMAGDSALLDAIMAGGGEGGLAEMLGGGLGEGLGMGGLFGGAAEAGLFDGLMEAAPLVMFA
jgi:hypothetical protein